MTKHCRAECWLCFDTDDGYAWDPSRLPSEQEQTQHKCRAHPQALRDWVAHVRKHSLLPLPGMCTVLTGGPPCQSISGHNLKRTLVDILKDKRNRLCFGLTDMAELLLPEYVVMEQVTDILTVEGGRYAKTVVRKLLLLGYQVRFSHYTILI